MLHLCDLQAARNCLIGGMNTVKVADYSLALYTSSRKPSRTVVSVRWAAPELIVQQPMFTTKSDVWSFGECTYTSICVSKQEVAVCGQNFDKLMLMSHS